MTVTFTPIVDISLNQGLVDMAKMRATGVKGLILRVSHGKTLDTRYPAYYRDALAAGFEPDDICHYTFVNPKRGTAVQCASTTLDEIYRVVGHVDVGFMYDVENYAGQSPNIGAAPVYGQAFATYLRTYIAEVGTEAPAARDFGYSNRAYWNGKVPGTTQEWVGDDALAAELDWLVARYPAYSDDAYAHYGYPGTPDTWQEWAFRAQQQGPLPPRGATWLGWQFSAGWNRQGTTYGATSRDLDLNIVHPDAWARWTGKIAPTPPDPPLEDDMKMYYLSPSDAPARFIGEGTDGGLVRRCEWTGDGGDPAVGARVAFFKAAGMVDMVLATSDLINVSLDGALPPGLTAEQFANPAEIRARDGASDAAIIALNDAVGRTKQDIHEVRVGLGKLAPS